MSNDFPGLPPAPPASFGGKGCARVALIGCGGLVVLAVLAMLASSLWFRDNQDELETVRATSVQEGARFGLRTDEAGCFEEGKRRAAAAKGFSGQVGTGVFVGQCLEFSQPSAGFCENVPPPTAIRRTVAFHQERCKGDASCAGVLPLIQTYCTAGRRKRPASDTVGWGMGGDSLPGWVQPGVDDSTGAGAGSAGTRTDSGRANAGPAKADSGR